MSKLSERLKGYTVKPPQKDIKEILQERGITLEEPKQTPLQKIADSVKRVLFYPLF